MTERPVGQLAHRLSVSQPLPFYIPFSLTSRANRPECYLQMADILSDIEQGAKAKGPQQRRLLLEATLMVVTAHAGHHKRLVERAKARHAAMIDVFSQLKSVPVAPIDVFSVSG